MSADHQVSKNSREGEVGQAKGEAWMVNKKNTNASVVPPPKKLVQKMIFEFIVQSISSLGSSSSEATSNQSNINAQTVVAATGALMVVVVRKWRKSVMSWVICLLLVSNDVLYVLV